MPRRSLNAFLRVWLHETHVPQVVAALGTGAEATPHRAGFWNIHLERPEPFEETFLARDVHLDDIDAVVELLKRSRDRVHFVDQDLEDGGFTACVLVEPAAPHNQST